MVILVDTNIILDYFTNREPFTKNAKIILEKCVKNELKGFVAAHSISNIFFILRKTYSVEERKKILMDLCEILEVVGLTKDAVLSAIQNDDFSDFEDCLQMECAKEAEADFIVTRNIKDFMSSSIKAISPEEFLKGYFM